MLDDPVTSGIAGACVALAVSISLFQIIQHLRNYTEPTFQRYILRIVFLVPFYAVASYLSLTYRDYSIYFDTPRDCYEAWVIYNFMALCMAYVGGPGAVVVKADGRIVKPSWTWGTCCLPPMLVDGFFLRRCKQGTLQFVIAKPFLAAATIILFAANLFQIGNWSLKSGYCYISIIYNVCYTLALYSLLLFYLGCEEILAPYKPLMKFLLIKTVIFLTFWQGIVISMLPFDEKDGEALQNWIVCLEMFGASMMMLTAFPVKEYQVGGQAVGWRMAAVGHALSLNDVIGDIIHQFNPNYKSYLLYTDGGPADNVKKKKFRGGNKEKDSSFTVQDGGAKKKKKKLNKIRTMDRKAAEAGLTMTEDEEGLHWQNAFKKGGWVNNLILEKPKILVSWIPGITELERNQAELLECDSDAEYDEENQKDNQLDDDVLTTDDDDEQHQGAWKRQPNRGSTATLGRESEITAAGQSSSQQQEEFNPFPVQGAMPAGMGAGDSVGDFNPFPEAGPSAAFNPFPEVGSATMSTSASAATLATSSLPLVPPPPTAQSAGSTSTAAVPALAPPPAAASKAMVPILPPPSAKAPAPVAAKAPASQVSDAPAAAKAPASQVSDAPAALSSSGAAEAEATRESLPSTAESAPKQADKAEERQSGQVEPAAPEVEPHNDN